MAARAHRKLVAVLVVLATLTGFLAIFTVWADRQLLDTDNWVETSGQLLEDDAIRGQLAVFIADEVYANVPVQQELANVLPPRLQPLAGPAAGALRDLVERAALRFLERPRAQELWEQANRAAHSTFLAVIDDGGTGALDSSAGDVKLDLGVLVQSVAERAGVGGKIAGKIPPQAAQLEIIRSDQLEGVQDAVQFLRALAEFLVAITLILFGIAIVLAKGWRREAVRDCGLSLIVAGVGALVARELAGGAVVSALASTESVQPAAEDAFAIATSLLSQAASATIAYGVVIVLGTALAGPSSVATSARRAIAPLIRQPGPAYAGLAMLILMLILWAPPPAFEELVPTLLLTIFICVGFEALRRATAREFPDASIETWNVREWFASFGSRVRAAVLSGGGGGAASNRLDELERLGKLKDSGVLDAKEFEREKIRVLAG
ncbi:MAG: SHOCT domain-containing protein [Thermoleophilaceae bacterium]|nr:SHOCT domain-containing protein [Thermoleophilaceae bacterium]